MTGRLWFLPKEIRENLIIWVHTKDQVTEPDGTEWLKAYLRLWAISFWLRTLLAITTWCNTNANKYGEDISIKNDLIENLDQNTQWDFFQEPSNHNSENNRYQITKRPKTVIFWYGAYEYWNYYHITNHTNWKQFKISKDKYEDTLNYILKTVQLYHKGIPADTIREQIDQKLEEIINQDNEKEA